MFSAFQSTSSPLTDDENSVQIHALLEMPSFLKVVQNWPKMGFWIWRSAVAPSDTKKKTRNIGAQLHSLLYTTAKIFRKIYFLWTFGAHKLVRSEPFLDSRCEIWQLLLALYSEVGEIFLYKCISTFLALKDSSRIFWNDSAIYTKWCAQTFPPIF